MLEFPFGVACGAKQCSYVTPKGICSRYLGLCVIQMLEVPVGVACGAKKFLCVTQQKKLVHTILRFGWPAGAKSSRILI